MGRSILLFLVSFLLQNCVVNKTTKDNEKSLNDFELPSTYCFRLGGVQHTLFFDLDSTYKLYFSYNEYIYKGSFYKSDSIIILKPDTLSLYDHDEHIWFNKSLIEKGDTTLKMKSDLIFWNKKTFIRCN
jgi:hypothetical protein